MNSDPRVDEKIAEAPAFARPILTHLRRLVREGCPGAEETIKWGRVTFVYRGRLLCGMAAFKAHCGFGFWHPAMEQAIAREGWGGKADEAAGAFGRITRREDLPDDATLLRLIAEAARHNESGKPARPRPPGSPLRPEAVVPTDLALRLAGNTTAAAVFAGFSPSHRREYIEWINEAKREETRLKRLDATLEQLAASKPRHWKHQPA